MSHVGCRLMVASSANTRRRLAPVACGDIARAFATKAAMSSDADDLASGKEAVLPESAFWAEDTSVAGLDLVGSPAINAHQLQQALCGPSPARGQSGCNAAQPANPKRARTCSGCALLSSGLAAHRAQPGQHRS